MVNIIITDLIRTKKVLNPSKRKDFLTSVLTCRECGIGEMRRSPELDYPYSKDLLSGFGVWQAYKCTNCNYKEWSPFD